MAREPLAYLAGPMASGGETGGENEPGWNKEVDYARWRVELMGPLIHMGIQPRIPEAVGCDHSGIMPGPTVQGDLQMIDEADIVLAYLDSETRWGTITEIGYAAGRRKPVFIAVTEEAHYPIPAALMKQHSAADIWNQMVLRSGHACTCEAGAHSSGMFGRLWFPLATANGFKVVHDGDQAVTTLVNFAATWLKGRRAGRG